MRRKLETEVRELINDNTDGAINSLYSRNIVLQKQVDDLLQKSDNQAGVYLATLNGLAKQVWEKDATYNKTIESLSRRINEIMERLGAPKPNVEVGYPLSLAYFLGTTERMPQTIEERLSSLSDDIRNLHKDASLVKDHLKIKLVDKPSKRVVEPVKPKKKK